MIPNITITSDSPFKVNGVPFDATDAPGSEAIEETAPSVHSTTFKRASGGHQFGNHPKAENYLATGIVAGGVKDVVFHRGGEVVGSIRAGDGTLFILYEVEAGAYTMTITDRESNIFTMSFYVPRRGDVNWRFVNEGNGYAFGSAFGSPEDFS